MFVLSVVRVWYQCICSHAVVEQLLVKATQGAMQACGWSQGARDVISLPDFLSRDLMGVVDRMQVCSDRLAASIL